MCDSNLSCVLMLNNNVIGVFNSIERLNNYVSGCVQNNFFTKGPSCHSNKASCFIIIFLIKSNVS